MRSLSATWVNALDTVHTCCLMNWMSSFIVAVIAAVSSRCWCKSNTTRLDFCHDMTTCFWKIYFGPFKGNLRTRIKGVYHTLHIILIHFCGRVYPYSSILVWSNIYKRRSNAAAAWQRFGRAGTHCDSTGTRDELINPVVLLPSLTKLRLWHIQALFVDMLKGSWILVQYCSE